MNLADGVGDLKRVLSNVKTRGTFGEIQLGAILEQIMTSEQYERFVKDLDYGGNHGLTALRFRLSTDHRVSGEQWMRKVRDLGVEPREILYGMQWRDGLKKHCEKLGVEWDSDDLEGSVRRVVDHYRK